MLWAEQILPLPWRPYSNPPSIISVWPTPLRGLRREFSDSGFRVDRKVSIRLDWAVYSGKVWSVRSINFRPEKYISGYWSPVYKNQKKPY
jgi:hypothetical protein